jgi:large subunit ribosomal protein L3
LKKETKILGFAAWKAGMTHVLQIDGRSQSPTHGKSVAQAATILDAPPLFVAGIRFYTKTPDGLVCVGEKWAQIPKELEIERKTKPAKKTIEKEKIAKVAQVRLLVATQPKKSGMAKRKPDLLEIAISGEPEKACAYAESLLGKELYAKDVFRDGEFVDVSAVTSGHGFMGPVKRFGIRIQGRKDKQMHRHTGSIGSTVPRRVDWRVPLPGQDGFHTRTEYNKQILMIGDDPQKINQKGGIINYGVVPKSFLLIKGSVPGHAKRLVILRKPSRPRAQVPVDIKYISTSSKQGV